MLKFVSQPQLISLTSHLVLLLMMAYAVHLHAYSSWPAPVYYNLVVNTSRMPVPQGNCPFSQGHAALSC